MNSWPGDAVLDAEAVLAGASRMDDEVAEVRSGARIDDEEVAGVADLLGADRLLEELQALHEVAGGEQHGDHLAVGRLDRQVAAHVLLAEQRRPTDVGLAGHQLGVGGMRLAEHRPDRALAVLLLQRRRDPDEVVAVPRKDRRDAAGRLGKAVDDVEVQVERRLAVQQRRRRGPVDVDAPRRVEHELLRQHVGEQLAQWNRGVTQFAIDEIDGLDDLPGAQRDLVRPLGVECAGRQRGGEQRQARERREGQHEQQRGELDADRQVLHSGNGDVHVVAPSSRARRRRTVAAVSGRPRP